MYIHTTKACTYRYLHIDIITFIYTYTYKRNNKNIQY